MSRGMLSHFPRLAIKRTRGTVIIMKKIGTLSNGNCIVEMTHNEWGVLATNEQKLNGLDLAAAIKAYRKRTGETQQRLADKTGVSRNYISQLEHGKAVNVSLDIYQRIVREIG